MLIKALFLWDAELHYVIARLGNPETKMSWKHFPYRNFYQNSYVFSEKSN